MFKVRVIPCLDVKDGRVVKGVNFVNLRDAGDPVAAAVAYDAAGADELTFLDITASHENRGIILDVVRRTAEACFMPVTVGGGVRTTQDIRALLRAGADKVSINTAAVNNRQFVQEAAQKFGDQRKKFLCSLEVCQVPGTDLSVCRTGDFCCQFGGLRDDLIVSTVDYKRGARNAAGLSTYIDSQIEFDLACNPLPIGNRHVRIDHVFDRRSA